MKKLALITMIAILLTASWADAQPGRGNGMNKGGKAAYMQKFPGFHFYDMYQDELKLDDSQMKKMEQLDDAFQKERIDMQAKMKYAGLELKKELDQKTINKAEILKKQEVIQNLKNAMQKKAMEYKIDLFNLLTDDQKDKMDDIKKSCRKDGRGQGMGRGQGKGNCDGSGRGQG